MKGRSMNEEGSGNSQLSPDSPETLSKQHQKQLFPRYTHAPPNSKKRNPKEYMIAPIQPPNSKVSKFDRLMKQVEENHSEDLENIPNRDRELTPDLLIENKLMSQKDSQKSISMNHHHINKNMSRDSFDPNEDWPRRKKLKRGKMTDSQVIQNTLISNPEQARLAGRRSQNYSNFKDHPRGSLKKTMEVYEHENSYIVQEAVEYMRNSQINENNQINRSKNSEEPMANYVSGYDSKGRFLQNYHSKSSRVASGLREDSLGGMIRNDRNYHRKRKNQRTFEQPVWRGVISDDEPDPTHQKQRFHGTEPNLRFNHRGNDYESPHFNYNSPGGHLRRKGKDINRKLKEEARQIYGRTPKGLDPDQRVLKAVSPQQMIPQYPLAGMSRKQKRIASSSPIDPNVRNRVEKMKKKWIPAVVKKPKPMGYGQIDQKNEEFKKKSTTSIRKKKKNNETSRIKKKRKDIYGTYGGPGQYNPHGVSMSQGRQSSGNSWLRGPPTYPSAANKKKKKPTPNYHSDSQKPFAIKGTPSPYSKKSGNPYSQKTPKSKKNFKNKNYNPYQAQKSGSNTKVLPRVAMLQAQKKKKSQKKSYRNIYENNQKKGEMVHSRSGPRPSKFKHPKTVTKNSKSAGNSRAKKIGLQASRDQKKKKKRFRYKLSSKKVEEKRMIEEKKKRQAKIKREQENRKLEAQKNVMKMGKKMLHDRQNKDKDKEKEKMRKRKMMKFRGNKAVNMERYGYGTVPIRNLAEIPENDRVRSIPAKQPRRGTYNSRNTGSLQPKINRNSKSKTGKIAYGRRSNMRESHHSGKSGRLSNPKSSGLRSANMKKSKARSSNTRNSNVNSSNMRVSTKRSTASRSNKMRVSNMKSNNKTRGTSEFYTSKGYDTRGSDQHSTVSYPSNKAAKSRANLYRPKNRIKRNKQISEYASAKSKESQKLPKRSQTKPEIRKDAKQNSKFSSFGNRKNSRSRKKDSVLFKREQKSFEEALMEVEGHLKGMLDFRKSMLREKTKRSLSRKMKKFLRSANLREASPLATKRNLRFNKTDQNLTESEIRDSLIEGLQDDSRIYDNQTSLDKNEELIPPIEAPAELEASETDKNETKNSEMLSSVDISQTFQPNKPLLLSQVPNNPDARNSQSQIREQKDSTTTKNSLVNNFKTQGRETQNAEKIGEKRPVQDRISEVIQSDDKSKQMIFDSQLTVKKVANSFKKNKNDIIENEDLPSDFHGEEMKLANLKLKPGEAEEDLKKLLNGFSNRKLNLTGEVSLTNPKVKSLGMTGSMSLRVKNEYGKSIREPFMKNKNRSPRNAPLNKIIQSGKKKKKKFFQKIQSEALLIHQTDFQPNAQNKNQKDFLDFKKRMKKRSLMTISPVRSPRSSKIRSISREKKLTPLNQNRFKETQDSKNIETGIPIEMSRKIKRERTRSFSKERPQNPENPFKMKASGTIRKLKKFGESNQKLNQKKLKAKSPPQRKSRSPKRKKKSRSPKKFIKKSNKKLNEEFNLNVSGKDHQTSNESESERIKKVLGKNGKESGHKSKRNSKLRESKIRSKPNSMTNDSMISKDKLPDSIGQIKDLLVKGKIKKNQQAENQEQYIRKKLDINKLRNARLKRKKSQTGLKRDFSKDKEIIAGIRKDLSNKKLKPFGSLETDHSPNSKKPRDSNISENRVPNIFDNPQQRFKRISKNRSLEDLEAQNPYFNKQLRSKSPLRVIPKDPSEKKLKPLSKSPQKSLDSQIRRKSEYLRKQNLTKQVDLVTNPLENTTQSNTSDLRKTVGSQNQYEPSPQTKNPRKFKKFQQSLNSHPLDINKRKQVKKLNMFKSLVVKNSPQRFKQKKQRQGTNRSINTKPIELDLAEIEEKVRKMQRPESRQKFNQSQRMRITSYLQKSGSLKKKSLKRVKPKPQRIKRRKKPKESPVDNESATSSLSGLKFDQSIDKNFTMRKCPTCSMYFPLARLHLHIQNCS